MSRWLQPFYDRVGRGAAVVASVGATMLTLLLAQPASPVAAASSGNGCALCLYDGSDSRTLTLNGNTSVQVNNGSVTINSTASDAAVLNGNATVAASSIGVVGGVQNDGNSAFNPSVTTGVGVAADPLGSLAVPSLSGSQGDVIVGGNDSRTIGPGLYSRVDISGNASLTLTAGNYVVTQGLTVSGNATLNGQNAMLYFACSGYPTGCNAGEGGASLRVLDNATYQLTSPTGDTYQGVALFFDRNNTAPLRLNGNGSITGTVYATAASLRVGGNGSATLNSLVLVKTLHLAGNGNVTVNYNSGQNSPQVSWPS